MSSSFLTYQKLDIFDLSKKSWSSSKLALQWFEMNSASEPAWVQPGIFMNLNFQIDINKPCPSSNIRMNYWFAVQHPQGSTPQSRKLFYLDNRTSGGRTSAECGKIFIGKKTSHGGAQGPNHHFAVSWNIGAACSTASNDQCLFRTSMPFTDEVSSSNLVMLALLWRPQCSRSMFVSFLQLWIEGLAHRDRTSSGNQNSYTSGSQNWRKKRPLDSLLWQHWGQGRSFPSAFLAASDAIDGPPCPPPNIKLLWSRPSSPLEK